MKWKPDEKGKNMKTGKSLEDLARTIKEQAAMKHDFIAPSELFNLSFSASLKKLMLGYDADGNGVHDFVLSDTAMRNIADYCKIPQKYWNYLNSLNHVEAVQLLCRCTDFGMQKIYLPENQKRMFRTYQANDTNDLTQDILRCMLSPSYRRLDNEEVAETVLPILLDGNDAGRYEIISSEITEKKLYIKAVNKSIQKEISRGDVVESGVIIRNSETGEGMFDISPFLNFLYCDNGMVVADQAMKTRHLMSSQANDNEIFQMLTDETKQKENEVILSKCRDVLIGCMKQEQFERNVNRLIEAKTQVIEKPLQTVDILSKSFGLSDFEKESVLDRIVNKAEERDRVNGMATILTFINAFTNVGNDLSDYDRATDFQQMGGVILTMHPKKLSRVA